MLKDILERLGSLALEEKGVVEEAVRVTVVRALGAQEGWRTIACHA